MHLRNILINPVKIIASKADYTYEFPIDKNRTKTIHRCRFRLGDFKSDERMLLFGLTGTGKTYLAKKIMKFVSKTRLVVLLDTKREYRDIPELTEEKLLDKKSKGLYRTFQIEFNNLVIEKPTIICEFLAANLFKRGNCLLVVEEIAELVPKISKPLPQIMPHLGKYIQQGRLFKCAFIGTSQRPADTHTSLSSQSNHIISFYMSLEHDVKYLKKWFPEEIYSKFIKEKNEPISHEFVRFHVNTQETFHHFRYYSRGPANDGNKSKKD